MEWGKVTRMPFIKRLLVHLSILIGISSIVLEQDQWISAWMPEKSPSQDTVSSDILLTDAIRENLKAKAEKAPPESLTPSKENLLTKEVLSFQDLKSHKWTGPRLKLISAFSEEQMRGRQIFEQLSTYSSLSHIFKNQVVGFERGTLRSGSYRNSSGFDQIYYKIYYPSGRIAHVIVKEGESIDMIIYTPSDKGYLSQGFKDGVWSHDQPLTDSEAEGQIQDHLKGSLPVLSAAIGAIY